MPTNTLDMSVFNARFKEARAAAKMSPTEFQEMTGLSPTTMWKMENDPKISLRVRTLWEAAAALGVDPAWLMGWNGPQELPQRPSEDPVAKQIARMIRLEASRQMERMWELTYRNPVPDQTALLKEMDLD